MTNTGKWLSFRRDTSYLGRKFQKSAININPKLAWAGVGSLWGFGIGANIQLAPGWELVPEANIVMDSLKKSNGTLGIRWNATDDITIEAYGTTASSIIDMGQLLNAEEIRWGSRISIKTLEINIILIFKLISHALHKD